MGWAGLWWGVGENGQTDTAGWGLQTVVHYYNRQRHTKDGERHQPGPSGRLGREQGHEQQAAAAQFRRFEFVKLHGGGGGLGRGGMGLARQAEVQRSAGQPRRRKTHNKRAGHVWFAACLPRREGRQTDMQVAATLLYPFPGPASSPCPFTLAARPNTIIRDLGRGVPMGGAATFLASPWGGGSDAAATRPSASCAATTAHSRGAWRPWITLEAWRRTGVGWACLPRARRQGKSQKVKPVLPSSHCRPFWAAHPSAPGGSFAFGMMKCHARCTLPGRTSVRVTGQASD